MNKQCKPSKSSWKYCEQLASKLEEGPTCWPCSPRRTWSRRTWWRRAIFGWLRVSRAQAWFLLPQVSLSECTLASFGPVRKSSRTHSGLGHLNLTSLRRFGPRMIAPLDFLPPLLVCSLKVRFLEPSQNLTLSRVEIWPRFFYRSSPGSLRLRSWYHVQGFLLSSPLLCQTHFSHALTPLSGWCWCWQRMRLRTGCRLQESFGIAPLLVCWHQRLLVVVIVFLVAQCRSCSL